MPTKVHKERIPIAEARLRAAEIVVEARDFMNFCPCEPYSISKMRTRKGENSLERMVKFQKGNQTLTITIETETKHEH